MAKISKKEQQKNIAASYVLRLLLEKKDISLIYSYCRAYIHLGKVIELSDLFTAIRTCLGNYQNKEGFLLPYNELECYYKKLDHIYDNLF